MWSKSASPTLLRLDKIVRLQEQVTPYEAPDRVECLEGQDRGGGDPHGPDLQVECLKCTVLSLLAAAGQ